MIGQILIYVVIGFTAAALGVFVFLLFPSRRQLAGSTTEGEIAEGATQRSTLVASLVAASPSGYVGWVERQIVFAGRPVGWTPARVFMWKVVLGATGALLGLMFVMSGGPNPLKVLMVVAGVVLLFFAPDVIIQSRASERQRAITMALPDTLDQMTIAVEAGLGFDAAMAKAARGNDGPLAVELVRVLQDMSLGRTRRDAFVELERRSSSEDLRRFGRAVIQADAYGIAIADVLRVQAGDMRLKRRQRAELQAQKVAVKILFPLVFCLLPVMFIVILTPALVSAVQTFSR